MMFSQVVVQGGEQCGSYEEVKRTERYVDYLASPNLEINALRQSSGTLKEWKR